MGRIVNLKDASKIGTSYVRKHCGILKISLTSILNSYKNPDDRLSVLVHLKK